MVIVISETLAREYWKEPATAIGKRVRCCNPKMPWREIVGVTGDERDDGVDQPATAIVYFPMLNESYRWRTMAYAVRSSRVGTPGFLARARAGGLVGQCRTCRSPPSRRSRRFRRTRWPRPPSRW